MKHKDIHLIVNTRFPGYGGNEKLKRTVAGIILGFYQGRASAYINQIPIVDYFNNDTVHYLANSFNEITKIFLNTFDIEIINYQCFTKELSDEYVVQIDIDVIIL